MKKHDTHNRKRKNPWKISAVILGIILVASVLTGGFTFNKGLDPVINDLNSYNMKQASPAVKSAVSDAIASLERAKSLSSSSGKTEISKNSGSGTGYGNPDGILIEEFSDFECPFCTRAVPTVQRIKEEYGDKVYFVYRHFPLSSIHPNAMKAAEASECAADQGKFWEYHDKLFENQRALDAASLKRHAAELGLDTATFNACLDSGLKSKIVQGDMEEGIKKGVQGTPTFFINGQKVVGAQPYESIKAIIDQQLAKA